MSNLLYYYGMCGLTKECLLQRYFSKVLENSHRFPISSWSIYRILLLCLWVFYFREFEAVDRPGSPILYRPVEEYVCHCHSCLHGEEAVLFFLRVILLFMLFFLQFLNERQSTNVWRFLESINRYWPNPSS